MPGEKFFLSNGVIVGNIRGVRRLVDAPSETYICTVDMQTVPQEPEVGVEYCAVAGDFAPTGQWVFAQVKAGNFDGELSDYVAPLTSIPVVEISA